MKKFGQSLKAAVAASAMLAGVGMAGEAKAFTFDNGDLVAALYGNTTEYLINLGSASTLLAPGATTHFTLTGSSAAGGTNPVQFSLVEYATDQLTFANAIVSSLLPFASYTPAQLSNSDAGHVFNLASGWQGIANTIVGDTVPSSDPRAWTNSNNFGLDQMGGAWATSTRGVFGSTLDLIFTDLFTGEKSLIGTAFLSGDGNTLTIAGLGAMPPVPIPAAVILFGTGLAGLVGVARRKMVVA